MIDVYLVSYNEEEMIQFTIDHYKNLFPGCRIIFYDNESTDNTQNIIKNNGCELRIFKTNNTFNEQVNVNIKNSCWKESSNHDWVCVGDVDELVQITPEELKNESNSGSTIIDFAGYTFVGPRTGFDLQGLKQGIRDGGHDKRHIFNRKQLTDINFGIGSHQANPKGNVVFTKSKYKTFHYKWVSLEYVVNRHIMYKNRLSDLNKKHGWGIQYSWTNDRHVEVYESLLPNLIDIK